jgi:phage terminase large subunit-like protein
MLRRVKGWGKDPVGATICAVEFVGPCRFDGWDANGDPVAIPHPAAWVLTAAVAKDQTRNTMTLFPGLLSADAIQEYEIDLGKELIYAHRGRCRLEAVTSSAKALEGARSTFTLKNETQHWHKNNEGHAMASVIARNLTKSRDGAARALAISNAHEPGEDSDAEHDYEAWLAIDQGKTRRARLLYDSLEAPPGTDLTDELQLRAGLIAARGNSIWLDLDTHVDEIYDTRNSVATSRRFYLNQIVAAEDAWIAPLEWDELAWDEAPPMGETKPEIAEGEQITLGFDGSISDDHCVLMGCRVSDGYTFTLGVWDPEDHEGEAPRELIDAAVRAAFARFKVAAFFSDLHPFESYVDAWAADFGKGLKIKASARHAIAWDMRAKQKDTTVEIERLHNEIVEKAFRHDGDKAVRQHFHNARRRPNNFGTTVGKEHRESKRKIDAVPATMLARTARRLLGPRKQKTGKAVFV